MSGGLALEGISHRYESEEVVRNVSLSVAPGEVACLLGPSGCGKTTLLRLAAGLETLQTGRVVIGERAVAVAAEGRHAPPEKRRVGLMFQDYALFPHLTVFDNVVFGIKDRTRESDARARTALERIGLAREAGSYPHTLSGGQQQRIALVRAIAPHPDVLLLDEPFSGLDVAQRADLREQTLDLLRDAAVTTLIVTHDPEEAMFLADRLLVMRAGRILQGGTPAEIYLHPLDRFVASLFGPLNRFDGVVLNGAVHTPLGTFPAPRMTEGAPAHVFIRPEGIVANSAAAGPKARVIMARLLGRHSELRLAFDVAREPLRALVPGVYLPEEGTVISIGVHPDLAFVFPAT